MIKYFLKKKVLTDYDHKEIHSEEFIYDKKDNKKFLIIKIISQNDDIEHKELINLQVENKIIYFMLREINFYVITKNIKIITCNDLIIEFIQNDISKKSNEINSPNKSKYEEENSIQSKNLDNRGTKTIEKKDGKKNFDSLGFIEFNKTKIFLII